MEITEKYKDLEERKAKIALRESQGLRMLHDDFDSDWKQGNEPHGMLTFTDEPSPKAEPIMDLEARIDELEARIEKLEKV